MQKLVTIGFMVCVLAICIATTQVKLSVPAISAMVLATSTGVEKIMTNLRGGNMTFVGNMMSGKNMTMPGGNMTFGASIQNAKMHLMEAMMDLKGGDAKAAMMEMNLTNQGIKMHEQEIKNMMMEVKCIMTKMKEASNMTSKNATS
ncbi:MAG: hypothetical protein WBZ36_06040 [Candidatus Nitrosopolaris sp.]